MAQRNLILFALVLAGISFQFPLQADTPEALYQAGKYEEALQVLEQTTPPEQKESPSYHYNKGSLLLRSGKPGQALAHLEVANQLKPHDSDTQQHLSLARAALCQSLGGCAALDPSSDFMERLASRVPLEELRGVLGAFGLLLIGVWIRSYSRNRSLRKTFLRPSGVVGLFAFLVPLFLYWAQRAADDHPALIMESPQVLKSGPDPSTIDLGRAEAGVKVRYLGEQNGWFQIRFKSDGVAWIPASAVLKLSR